MIPIQFSWIEPPSLVRLDLLDAPAFVSKDGRLLLLLPRSPADHTGSRKEADARQVLDWATGKLGFMDPDSMVYHFPVVKIELEQDWARHIVKLPPPANE